MVYFDGTVAGVVLAAGGGTRFGGPKALATRSDGMPWSARAASVLEAAGCTPVFIVLGAQAPEASALLRSHDEAFTDADRFELVEVPDWEAGISASIRRALTVALSRPDIAAVAIVPVDVPDLNVSTVRRVLTGSGSGAEVNAATLRRAVFSGRPGHPVLIGRDHWEPLIATLRGDSGALAYLVAHDAEAVECGDLSTGVDRDVRE